jgi:hypothetical protein
MIILFAINRLVLRGVVTLATVHRIDSQQLKRVAFPDQTDPLAMDLF